MYSIAIDGPSGAGKSSLAKSLALYYDFLYVDTGALYRAIAYYFFEHNFYFDNELLIEDQLCNINISLEYHSNEQVVFLNNVNVNDKIRNDTISMMASKLSSYQCVRNYLFNLQRNIALKNNIVMDGRDVGTVILPDATVKIFLTASPESRAQRRYDEYVLKGQSCDYNIILDNIVERDHNDTTRKISPLKKADDAIVIDNSDFTAEQTFLKCVTIVNSYINKK